MLLIGKCLSNTKVEKDRHYYAFNRPDTTLMMYVKCQCGDRIELKTIQSYRTFKGGKVINEVYANKEYKKETSPTSDS